MKLPSTIASLTLFTAAFSFTGCVDPYYAGGGGVAVTSTTYRPGYSVTTLPSGYRTEVISGTSYYHHGDVYYRPQGRGYVVVESPHRHHDGNRPGGRDRDRDGRPDRYESHGDYHGERVIRQLPNGYQTVTHRGTRYYRAGDVYYQSRGEGYIIVRSPF